jgi:hypothetical protein
VRPAIEQVALKTFHEAYVPAMRTTLLIPIGVLVLAVICSFLVRRTDGDDRGRKRAGSGP